MMSVPSHSTTPPSPPAPAAASRDGPLSPDHLAAISAARLRGKKIRRAAMVATISGWTMGAFAVITLMGGLFGDWLALAIGIPLGLVAFFELRGAAMIRRFLPSGATLLACNQLGLALVLIAYAGYMLIQTVSHPILGGAGGQSTGDPQIDAMMGDLSRTIGLVLYGGLMVFGLVGPGLTALYYQSRRGHIERMLDQTPEWVIHAMRAAG
jgi:hypothetical protein